MNEKELRNVEWMSEQGPHGQDIIEETWALWYTIYVRYSAPPEFPCGMVNIQSCACCGFEANSTGWCLPMTTKRLTVKRHVQAVRLRCS